jgi:hypothetical protein
MTITGEDCRDSPGAPANQELSAILRTAKELTANSAVVLFLSGSRLEVVHRWSDSSRSDARWTDSGASLSSAALLNGGPELHRALAQGGVVKAGAQVAHILRAAAPTANSFLLFTRQIRKCVVTIAFGFAAEHSPHASVPQAAAERLDLAAFATWSARQLNQLHTELQVVNQKLAGRKLVERAKSLLQAELQIDEQQAYEYLRKKSRQRRITIAKLAEEVLRRSAAEIGPLFEME